MAFQIFDLPLDLRTWRIQICNEILIAAVIQHGVTRQRQSQIARKVIQQVGFGRGF
jgi:hypothetical protein